MKNVLIAFTVITLSGCAMQSANRKANADVAPDKIDVTALELEIFNVESEIIEREDELLHYSAIKEKAPTGREAQLKSELASLNKKLKELEAKEDSAATEN
ncbi:MAG: hypothetical protein KDD25_05935 [Bdellovibrionales bacterium]|nr:hypothetical protein [Bdellovibrionales bacterium]